jgi:RNA polymerase sigma-70 factor (ECF subfamily)
LAERTTAVLGVVYLLFNEGYTAPPDKDGRRDLCDEAIHLARTVSRLMPADPEAAGLLALMLLHHSRAAARVDANGDLVPLDEQDRTQWSAAAIGEGLVALQRASAHDTCEPGPYRIQAEIAACHATALDPGRTNWARIADLYDRLVLVAPSPVVALNRAVAVGLAEGPRVGLALLAELEHGGALAGYHLLAAAKGDLLRRAGDHAAAAAESDKALELAPTEPERRFLRRRVTEGAV